MTAAPGSPTTVAPARSIGPALLLAYAVLWTALGIAPRFRQDWLLENLLVFAALPWLVHKWRVAPFTNRTYVALFVFFALHAVGAHYTYSEVPYDAWWQSLTGSPLDGSTVGPARNHYDRLVHFAYGLLMSPAAIELVDRAATPRGLWRWLLPWAFLCSHSVVYELIEWCAALLFGGDLGVAYLGTQGDVWDAQKDMALASGGAALGLALLRLLPARGTSTAPRRAQG